MMVLSMVDCSFRSTIILASDEFPCSFKYCSSAIDKQQHSFVRYPQMLYQPLIRRFCCQMNKTFSFSSAFFFILTWKISSLVLCEKVSSFKSHSGTTLRNAILVNTPSSSTTDLAKLIKSVNCKRSTTGSIWPLKR